MKKNKLNLTKSNFYFNFCNKDVIIKFNALNIRNFTKLSLLLILSSIVTACAGVSGLNDLTRSWKEEVALHDVQTIIVKCTFERGGRRELGQSHNAIYESLALTPTNSH